MVTLVFIRTFQSQLQSLYFLWSGKKSSLFYLLIVLETLTNTLKAKIRANKIYFLCPPFPPWVCFLVFLDKAAPCFWLTTLCLNKPPFVLICHQILGVCWEGFILILKPFFRYFTLLHFTLFWIMQLRGFANRTLERETLFQKPTKQPAGRWDSNNWIVTLGIVVRTLQIVWYYSNIRAQLLFLAYFWHLGC